MSKDNPGMSETGVTWRHYFYIARPDHWVKNIFILPGVVAAIVLTSSPALSIHLATNVFIGIISVCLIASANYVINEWLDAESDKFHPEKSSRPAANGLLKARYVYIEYCALAICGVLLASRLNFSFFAASVMLLISGITYNVKPFRTKDRVYVDVLSEAINNPIRLAMGWAMISSTTVPPLSLVMLYWSGGAFLMAVKRLSEYNFIFQQEGSDAPGKYRKSFLFYSSERLIISCFVYALFSAFGIAVFLVKYKPEFVFAFPLVVLLFAYYLYLGFQKDSVAQKPEKLHKDGILVGIVLALTTVLTVCAFVNMPYIDKLLQSRSLALW